MSQKHKLGSEFSDPFFELKTPEPEEGEPQLFVQWKGTDLCGDFHCACGSHQHLDEMFVYSIACLRCGKHFKVQSTLFLVECGPREESRSGLLVGGA